jgi:hypothetical protein
MDGFQPYPIQPDPGPSAVGQADSDRTDPKYNFKNLEALFAHFSQWLPPNLIHNLVETEKSVFVVRKECSLEETRLQFLKKCEMSLLRVMSQPEPGSSTGEWYPAA